LGVSHDVYWGKKLVYKGWKLDLKKFRIYLTEKFLVKKAYLFMGYLRENEYMYQNFRDFGYDLVFKEVTKDFYEKPKGNVDAELVLQSAAIDYGNYDKAVIVTGDGDFKCLLEFLIKRNKYEMLLVPNRLKYSNLLGKSVGSKITFLNRAKEILELKRSVQHKH
jgi:uncharacterized LabA/DUF88 family protein